MELIVLTIMVLMAIAYAIYKSPFVQRRVSKVLGTKTTQAVADAVEKTGEILKK